MEKFPVGERRKEFEDYHDAMKYLNNRWGNAQLDTFFNKIGKGQWKQKDMPEPIKIGVSVIFPDGNRCAVYIPGDVKGMNDAINYLEDTWNDHSN